MAKKKKNSSVAINSVRNPEKLRLICRQFDRSMIYYVLLVLLCSWIGSRGGFVLERPAAHGFALYFVVFPSYLLMLLAKGVEEICGFAWEFAGLEVWFCMACDLIMAMSVWLLGRYLGKKRSPVWLKNGRLFVMIMVYWGVFQLICTTLAWLCRLK